MFDLTRKVALVTGGNGGIGLGMARGLAQAGATVVVAGRNSDKTREAVRKLHDELGAQAHAVLGDVAIAADAQRIIDETQTACGGLDILINNAGINIRKPPDQMELEEWQRVLDVNLTSAYLLSKFAYPFMKKAGGGKVINIGSMTSIFGAGFAPAYATSKGGIVQLTKSCALAWAADNIQVNAILPGWFDTELTQTARVEVPDLYGRVLGRIPMGRWAKPADIAGTAVWLASSASDYVTGIAVPVDGGYTSAL
jgi:2-deoxy-D-gluconate 3-dehydrogenase